MNHRLAPNLPDCFGIPFLNLGEWSSDHGMWRWVSNTTRCVSRRRVFSTLPRMWPLSSGFNASISRACDGGLRSGRSLVTSSAPRVSYRCARYNLARRPRIGLFQHPRARGGSFHSRVSLGRYMGRGLGVIQVVLGLGRGKQTGDDQSRRPRPPGWLPLLASSVDRAHALCRRDRSLAFGNGDCLLVGPSGRDGRANGNGEGLFGPGTPRAGELVGGDAP